MRRLSERQNANRNNINLQEGRQSGPIVSSYRLLPPRHSRQAATQARRSPPSNEASHVGNCLPPRNSTKNDQQKCRHVARSCLQAGNDKSGVGSGRTTEIQFKDKSVGKRDNDRSIGPLQGIAYSEKHTKAASMITAAQSHAALRGNWAASESKIASSQEDMTDQVRTAPRHDRRGEHTIKPHRTVGGKCMQYRRGCHPRTRSRTTGTDRRAWFRQSETAPRKDEGITQGTIAPSALIGGEASRR